MEYKGFSMEEQDNETNYNETDWIIQSASDLIDVDMTYRYFGSRFSNLERDIIKSAIQIQSVSVYDYAHIGQKPRTKFIVKSYSYPQYYPYYTKHDKRGRTRSFQRT